MSQSGELAYLAILEDITRVVSLYVLDIRDAWKSADAKALLERIEKNCARIREQVRWEDAEERTA